VPDQHRNDEAAKNAIDILEAVCKEALRTTSPSASLFG
jgi:hypothetical protein